MRIEKNKYKKETNGNFGSEEYNNWMENFLEAFNSRPNQAREKKKRFRGFKDKIFTVIQSEEQKEKEWKTVRLEREFLGGPVVITQCFHFQVLGSIPGQETKIP